MKTVVITGSARGLGYNMARFFREYNYNVVISDLNEEKLKIAKEELEKTPSEAEITYTTCNVSKIEELQDLMNFAVEKFGEVDIWINNAGVNQPQKAIWELTEQEINTIIDVDLKGAIFGSKVAIERKLSPGIMITEFTTHSLGNDKIELAEKTKKVYNILGDTPETVGKFLVDKMVNNTKNNVKFNWLTNGKAFTRFLTAGFNKRNFFGDDQKLLTNENKKK